MPNIEQNEFIFPDPSVLSTNLRESIDLQFVDELLDQSWLSDLSDDSSQGYHTDNSNDFYNEVPSHLNPDFVQVKISDNNGMSIITTGFISFNRPNPSIPIEEVTSINQVRCFPNIEILLSDASNDNRLAVVGSVLRDTNRRGVVVVLASELRDYFTDHIKVELVDNF